MAGSAKALIMLACLIWRRDGRNVETAYQDILDGRADFDLNEMLQSMAVAGEAEAKAAQDAEDAAGLPTPAGSGPAGSPTTSSATSASSPSTSTSAPGKSGSSKSRSSRR